MSHHLLPRVEKPTRTMLVHGAGGIVIRRVDGGGLEVCLVHNAKDNDWSFPHGRLERGESHLACLHREVREEAGVVAQELRSLDTTRYKTPSRYDGSGGKNHATRYWLMVLKEDLGGPQDRSILGRRWCSVSEAFQLLTWDHDKELLRGADLLPPVSDR